MEFYKDKIASIRFDAAHDCLVLTYLSRVPNDEAFIKINSAVLDAFKKLNTKSFVADIRQMGIISLKAQQWVVENLLPGMLKHLNGKLLFHAQLLDAKDVLSKVSGSNIKSRSKELTQGFEVVQFTSEEELFRFLKSRKEVSSQTA